MMALDHVRDFFNLDSRFFDPTDLTRATPLLFFTRWITHFCAPSFVFLRGPVPASGHSRGRTPAQAQPVSGEPAGLWLIVVELTSGVVGWTFNLAWSFIGLPSALGDIGWSMILLAALARLPLRVVAAIGLILIAGHNLLDGIHPRPLLGSGVVGGTSLPFGNGGALGGALSPDATLWDWVWSFLHVFNPPVAYPLIPWVGVMAAGYASVRW